MPLRYTWMKSSIVTPTTSFEAVRLKPRVPAELVDSKSGSNSMVESQPSKLLVAGSIPVSRSTFSGAARS